ncbi:tRNA methyltransferase 10 homolog C [Rhinophrynus dorsalis]
MGFINTVLRTVRSPAFHFLVQNRGSRWLFLKAPCQLSQCRTLMLSQCWRKDEPMQDSSEKVDLEEWKNIMRSGVQNSESKLGDETQEESSLTAMRELVEMWRLAGRAVPESITTEQLQVLMELPTKTSRKKYLKFLSIKELVKKNRKEKKQELSKLKKETLDLSEAKEEKTEKKNSYLLHFWDKSIDNMQRWKCAQAMTFGQPLVFDMVYEKYMSRSELENTVCQLMESEGWNRRSADPFHIHFCSLQPDGPYHKELVKRYTGAWDNVLVTATEKSHADFFPRDQLVYLTADSPTELKKFDHNKVYIIGSLVDKCQQTGLSLANAKRLNLATARLPLERYLKWDVGAKNLTLDQMIRILLCLKDTGDWKKALSFVPKRKHEGFVFHSHSAKKDLKMNSKLYEFGKSKTFKNPQKSENTSAIPKQKRWWEEEN